MFESLSVARRIRLQLEAKTTQELIVFIDKLRSQPAAHPDVLRVAEDVLRERR